MLLLSNTDNLLALKVYELGFRYRQPVSLWLR